MQPACALPLSHSLLLSHCLPLCLPASAALVPGDEHFVNADSRRRLLAGCHLLCVGFQKVQKLSLLTNVCTASAGWAGARGKWLAAEGGGNFAKTFLNLNKRKFGAQSCPSSLPGCRGTCATRCNFSNAINFCTQQRVKQGVGRRARERGAAMKTVSQQCVRTKFSSLAAWSRAGGQAAASTFCFSHPTWECTN